jgi:hypothetical protein
MTWSPVSGLTCERCQRQQAVGDIRDAHRGDVKAVAREAACREEHEVSRAPSERVLDPDAVNRLAVLQVLAEQHGPRAPCRRVPRPHRETLVSRLGLTDSRPNRSRSRRR